MPGPNEIVAGGLQSAGRVARQGAAALLGVHVARALYGRWRRLSAPERDRLGPLAEDVKGRALDLRGAADPGAAGRELRAANEKLVDAMVESAQHDPEVSEIEVRRLREDLSRELERLASADIEARRGPGRAAGTPRAPRG